MEGAGLETGLIFPGDRFCQNIIDLKTSRTRAEFLQLLDVRSRKPVAGDGDRLCRCRIEKGHPGCRKAIEGIYRPGGLDLSAKLFEMGSHCKSNCMGARSEEHTSELQSRGHLVCRLL